MRAFSPSTPGRSRLGGLLAWTVGGCFVIFGLLQLWRPCYFLTDDNLSGTFPMLTEMGRALRAGHAPFKSDYLFGGNYNLLRDLDCIQWHPFTLLPALLADTAARFWIIDISALLLLLLATVGFTLLVHTLREELSLKIPEVYLVFYTLSFVFCTYILTVGPSWIMFLGNQSALPWLVLGILDRKVFRATLLILVFTAHEILAAYPPPDRIGRSLPDPARLRSRPLEAVGPASFLLVRRKPARPAHPRADAPFDHGRVRPFGPHPRPAP